MLHRLHVAKVALKRAGHAMPHTTFVPDDLNYAGSPWLSIEPGLYSTGSDGTVELPIKNESKTVGMTLDRGDYVGEAQILNDDEIMHISHDLEDDVMAGLSEKDKTVIKMWQEEMKFCEWKAPGLEESVVRSFCKEQGGSSSVPEVKAADIDGCDVIAMDRWRYVRLRVKNG